MSRIPLPDSMRESHDLVVAAHRAAADRRPAKQAPTQPAHDGARAPVPTPSWRHRELFAADQVAPPTVTVDGCTFLFTGYGREFSINEDHPATFGSHLLGREGTLGRFAYYA